MKIALVTGSTRGIGKEIARQLIEKGFRVVITGREEKQIKEIALELGENAVPVQLDVADKTSIAALEKFMKENFSHLDVLVNNAGILTREPMLDFDMDAIHQVFDTNFFGVLEMTKAVMPLLKKSNDARIINMSSEMGALKDLALGGHAAYRLSKAGVNAITIMLASELDGSTIKVNAVCPGWVRTDMGGPGAHRSVEKGAETPVWLVTEKNIPNGKFLRDKKELSW